jgi:hypothetical protein
MGSLLFLVVCVILYLQARRIVEEHQDCVSMYKRELQRRKSAWDFFKDEEARRRRDYFAQTLREIPTDTKWIGWIYPNDLNFRETLQDAQNGTKMLHEQMDIVLEEQRKRLFGAAKSETALEIERGF